MSCLGQLHSFSRNRKMYSIWVRKTQEEFHLLSNVAHFTLLCHPPPFSHIFKFPLSQALQKGLPQGDFGFQRVVGASSSWQVASELLDPGEVELVQVQVDTLRHLWHLEPFGRARCQQMAQMGIFVWVMNGLWVKTSRNFALMGWNLWCPPPPKSSSLPISIHSPQSPSRAWACCPIWKRWGMNMGRPAKLQCHGWNRWKQDAKGLAQLVD